jgi:hypothetical protein
MSPGRPRTAPFRRSAALFVSAATLAAAGCGRKLPPEAPLQVLPARVEPVRLSQEGSDAVIRFPYPSRTTTGVPLEGLARVTIYRELLPAPQGAMVPPPPAGTQREREERLFLTRAEKIRELTRSELDAATSGGDVVVRDSLTSLFAGKRLGRLFLRYGVTATRDRRKVSDLSPLVAIRPLVPPGEPTGLVALVEEPSVCLEWERPAAMLDGSTPVAVETYAIFRRDCVPGAEPVYEDPVAFEKLSWFRDRTVQPDRKYCYTVRGVPPGAPRPGGGPGAKEEPIALGPPADEVMADTRDVFAPPEPEGLQVLAELDGNRLVWNPVLAQDLDHYRVYRRSGPASPWERLPFAASDTTFFDAGGNTRAVYAVSAVDRSGNESRKVEVAAEKPPGPR